MTKSDDEWSIALCAFSHAIDTYQLEKGSFLTYAEVVIRRDLIDAHRADGRRAFELIVSPDAFEGETEESVLNPVLDSMIDLSMRANDRTLQDEILAANEVLRQYGFGFYDLTSCSPGQNRTRKVCARAADAVLASAPQLSQLTRTQQLPLKQLVERDGIPKKILERYRKYIIAMIVIRAGDYPALQGYLSGGRGEVT